MLAAFVMAAVSSGKAAKYTIDGMLEEGDLQDPEYAGSYFDAIPFEAELGDEIGLAITGMNVMPHVSIHNADQNIIYATHGVLGNDLTVQWKAPASGSYTFVLTEPYKAVTPYHMMISDLPQGTVWTY